MHVGHNPDRLSAPSACMGFGRHHCSLLVYAFQRRLETRLLLCFDKTRRSILARAAVPSEWQTCFKHMVYQDRYAVIDDGANPLRVGQDEANPDDAMQC